jgi:hypothetical protein
MSTPSATVRSLAAAAWGNIAVVVRLACLALLVPLGAACDGTIQSKLTEGVSPEEAVAIEKWEKKAMPVFSGDRTKCVTCHDGTVTAAPPYLAGDDDLAKRETLVAFMPKVVNLLSEQSSRIVTVGDHTAMGGGPAMLTTEQTDVFEWIDAERLARPVPDPIRTDPFTPMLCTSGNPGDVTCPINTVDLSAVGPTPVPATFSFVLQSVNGDSYYTQLKLKAGADGVYIEHPQIETYVDGGTDPTADPLDRLFAVVLNIQANQEMPIGSGTATIVGFKPTDPISFRFDVIDKVHPGT